jgi:hypothetical protein
MHIRIKKKSKTLLLNEQARHGGSSSVIPASWEAEMRRTAV